jgi:hypothetical protein
VPGSWYDERSAVWLGRERGHRPGMPLATGGAMGRRRRGRLDAEDATGLQRAGDRTRWRRGGRPGAGYSTGWQRAGDATALQLAVLHRVDPGGGVRDGGGGAGRWCRRRALAAGAGAGGAVSEAPTNAGRAPKFRSSSLSKPRFRGSAGAVFFARALKFPDRASFRGPARVALRNHIFI